MKGTPRYLLIVTPECLQVKGGSQSTEENGKGAGKEGEGREITFAQQNHPTNQTNQPGPSIMSGILYTQKYEM